MYRSKEKPVNPAPWKTGDDKVGTIIYDDRDNPVAVARTHELAKRIVQAINRGLKKEDEDESYV